MYRRKSLAPKVVADFRFNKICHHLYSGDLFSFPTLTAKIGVKAGYTEVTSLLSVSVRKAQHH
jgi:hypothetical protein